MNNAAPPLDLWNLPGAQATLHAHRENRVYRVIAPGGTFAMREHRDGYRTAAEITSEMDAMAMLSQAGISVPTPVAGADGAFLQTRGAGRWSLLTWLPGTPLGNAEIPIAPADRTGTFRALGQVMARMHRAADAWTPPAGFTRPDWRAEGLLGAVPVWGRFWDHPTLDPADRDLLTQFRDAAADHLSTRTLDSGFIHADLLRENVLVDETPGDAPYSGPSIRLIDFDDCAWGYRSFEVATALIRNGDAPDYGDLEAALLDGYRTERPFDAGDLSLFMALRLATYVGWIATRPDLPDAAARTAHNIAAANAAARAYLDRGAWR
ncbi:MAG: phosphotransferase [Pseudomonadota bacterium]